MECDSIRVALSAALDGEDPGVPADAVRAHLDGCADCRAWQERQHALTRQARLGGPALEHDLAPAVLAALADTPGRESRPGRRWLRLRPPAAREPQLEAAADRPPAAGEDRAEAARRSRPRWLPLALVVVALAQLAITVPLLVMGHDHDASAHAAHELGSFDLALAIAFVLGAVRPRLSAGLAWPCGIAAAGLVTTAVLGIIDGQTPGADEAQHLVALAGALLLFWQARYDAGAEQPGAAASPAPDPASLPWQWRPADSATPAAGPAASQARPDIPVATQPARETA